MNTILVIVWLVGSAIKKITKNDLLNKYVFLGRKTVIWKMKKMLIKYFKNIILLM